MCVIIIKPLAVLETIWLLYTFSWEPKRKELTVVQVSNGEWNITHLNIFFLNTQWCNSEVFAKSRHKIPSHQKLCLSRALDLVWPLLWSSPLPSAVERPLSILRATSDWPKTPLPLRDDPSLPTLSNTTCTGSQKPQILHHIFPSGFVLSQSFQQLSLQLCSPIIFTCKTEESVGRGVGQEL